MSSAWRSLGFTFSTIWCDMFASTLPFVFLYSRTKNAWFWSQNFCNLWKFSATLGCQGCDFFHVCLNLRLIFADPPFTIELVVLRVVHYILHNIINTSFLSLVRAEFGSFFTEEQRITKVIPIRIYTVTAKNIAKAMIIPSTASSRSLFDKDTCHKQQEKSGWICLHDHRE